MPDATAEMWREILAEKDTGTSAGRLMSCALTHRSWAHEANNLQNGQPAYSNERLEFLGDAVLQLAITQALYHFKPEAGEGDLSKLRARLVSEAMLARLARTLDMGKHLRLGQGELKTGGRERDSLLADALEAVIGAIFLSRGPETATRLTVDLWWREIEQASKGFSTDYKTRLFEYAQKNYGRPPAFSLSVTGPEHGRRFDAEVSLGGKIYGRGEGHSKRAAEQSACEAAWKKIEKEKEQAS